VALTARQRNALPDSAFIDRVRRRFPVPTKAQARRAGISEIQRLRTLRSALSRAGQQASNRARGTRRITPAAARRYVAKRAGGGVASVRSHPAHRTRRRVVRRRRTAGRRRR